MAALNENNEHSQDTLSKLRKVVKKVECCTEPAHCIKLLNDMNDEKVLVICSGSLGKDIVPQIHNMSNLVAIYIFCGNKALYTEWAKKWRKIEDVTTEIESICESMKKVGYECEY